MSKQIALVAEGKTDLIVIEAVLKAIIGNDFVLKLLQPIPTINEQLGGGWSGVFRWCRQYLDKGRLSYSNYDFLILQLDSDVATKEYSDGLNSSEYEQRNDLPCAKPCPPVSDTINELQNVVMGWLDLPCIQHMPQNWILCLPAPSSEAWLVIGYYPHNPDNIFANIECNLRLQDWLAQRPISEGKRFVTADHKKRTIRYIEVAGKITESWPLIRQLCTQAQKFHHDIEQLL